LIARKEEREAFRKFAARAPATPALKSQDDFCQVRQGHPNRLSVHRLLVWVGLHWILGVILFVASALLIVLKEGPPGVAPGPPIGLGPGS
jgi:hypothetical protein